MKIVYKIVSALMALAVLPAIVFSPIIYYYFSSVALQGLFTIGQLIGNETLSDAMEKYGLESVPQGIADTLSLYDLFDLVLRFSGNSGSGKFIEAIAPMIPSLIATGIAIVFVVICAIVTVVFAFACKDNRKVIASSFAGVGFSLMVPMLIENTVSPLVSGAINMTDFIDAFWASFIAEVEEISVTSIYYLIPALFACIALWTILYNATLPDKEKAERLKMIG